MRTLIKGAVTALFLLPAIPSASQSADIDLLRSVNSGNSTGWDNTNKVFSHSMTPVSLAAPSALLLYGILAQDSLSRKNGSLIGISLAATGAITVGMKYAFNRPRPFVTYPGLIEKKSEAGTPSFPSGHTSSAFGTATSLSLMHPKWFVIAPSFLWAGAVSYSRMELGVHYPSDVIAGAIIGAGCSFLMWHVNKKWRKKRKATERSI